MTVYLTLFDVVAMQVLAIEQMVARRDCGTKGRWKVR